MKGLSKLFSVNKFNSLLDLVNYFSILLASHYPHYFLFTFLLELESILSTGMSKISGENDVCFGSFSIDLC